MSDILFKPCRFTLSSYFPLFRRVYLLSGCSLLNTCDQLSLADDYLSHYEIYVVYIALIIQIIFYFFDLRYTDVKSNGVPSGEAWKVAVR